MSDSRLPTGPDFTSDVRLPIGPDPTQVGPNPILVGPDPIVAGPDSTKTSTFHRIGALCSCHSTPDRTRLHV